MALDFEIPGLLEELKKRKPKRVLVQLAEGIKQNSEEISDAIESLGIEVIFSGETSWGACSVAVHEAKELNVDLIVHFGHAEFMEVDFPIIYVEVKDILNLEPILKKSLSELKEFKVLGAFDVPAKKYLNLDEFTVIAKLPSREVLLAQLVGVMSGPIRAFMYIVDQLSKKTASTVEVKTN